MSEKPDKPPEKPAGGGRVWRHWPRFLAAIGLIAVFFGNAGFRTLMGNWRELQRLRGEIDALERDEKELDAKLRGLRSNDGGVERAARRDLGYIKKGEIEYRFAPPEKKE